MNFYETPNSARRINDVMKERAKQREQMLLLLRLLHLRKVRVKEKLTMRNLTPQKIFVRCWK